MDSREDKNRAPLEPVEVGNLKLLQDSQNYIRDLIVAISKDTKETNALVMEHKFQLNRFQKDLEEIKETATDCWNAVHMSTAERPSIIDVQNTLKKENKELRDKYFELDAKPRQILNDRVQYLLAFCAILTLLVYLYSVTKGKG